MAKLLSERRGAITVLTINRADVHNCVDGETATALATSIDAFARDPGARVLIVTGAGDKSFCSGADLKHAYTLMTHEWVERAGPMGFARLEAGKPTIAAVNGYCFAGGFELAAWCDFRVAGANAEFGALNRRWGVPFTDGGTQRFARIMGQGNALYMIETGVRIDAARAMAMGFVQEIVPPGQALARALELAGRIAGYPNASIVADRAATIATWGLSLRDGLRFEEETCLPTGGDAEMAVGLERFAAHDRPDAPRPPAKVNR
jgi:enoyl-CoA hydratase